MKTYDMTEVQVYAGDCQHIAENIAADIETAVFDEANPVKGDWEQIEKRLNEAGSTLWKIRQDISGGH